MAQPRPEDFGATRIEGGGINPEDFGATRLDDVRSPISPVQDLKRTASGSPMAGVAPYYLGPLGLARGAMDLQAYGQRNLDKTAYKAGEYVTEKAAQSSLSPETSAKLGFAANIGMQSIPVIAGAGLGKMFQPSLQSGAERVMQGALKPDKFMRDSGQAREGIQTMLKQGIGVSESSLTRVESRIDTLNTQIKDAIKNSSAIVNRDEVVKALDSVFDKAAKQSRSGGDLTAVLNAVDDFLTSHAKDIPVQLAQQIKQGTYASLGNKAYGSGLKPAIERDIDKALARGFKEEISKQVPAISGLNAQESKLLPVRDMIEARLSAQANNQPIGLGWLNPSTVLPWMLERNPGMLSLVARGMYGASGAGPVALGGLLGGAVGNYMGQTPQEERSLLIPPRR